MENSHTLAKMWGIILGLGTVILVGSLMIYAEVGFIHQDVNDPIVVKHTTGYHHFHHGTEGEVILAVVLLVAYAIVCGIAYGFWRSAKRGFPGW